MSVSTKLTKFRNSGPNIYNIYSIKYSLLSYIFSSGKMKDPFHTFQHLPSI